MSKKAKECSSYTIAALRNANKSLIEIQSEINSKAIGLAVKSLTNGGHLDLTEELSGLFRAYDRIQERFDSAVNSYFLHQERHICEIPSDLDELF